MLLLPLPGRAEARDSPGRFRAELQTQNFIPAHGHGQIKMLFCSTRNKEDQSISCSSYREELAKPIQETVLSPTLGEITPVRAEGLVKASPAQSIFLSSSPSPRGEAAAPLCTALAPKAEP